MQHKYEKNLANNGSEENSLSLTEKLPSELIQKGIAEYLSGKSLVSLSQASQTMFSHCSYPLAARKLLSHIVKGEESQAFKMINANPNLLLRASTATDYSSRTFINVTPFQVALLTHDVKMWKKIKPYFEMLSDGKIKKENQFKALFPQGIPDQKPYDFSDLIRTISMSSDADIQAALRREVNDTPICKAMKVFREAFTALSMKEVFFNPQHVMRAYRAYNLQLDNWSTNQCDLFWRQVIGYTERFLPAYYAQAFCEGLYTFLSEDKAFSRTLKLENGSLSWFPLPSFSGLGFDFGVHSYDTNAKPDCPKANSVFCRHMWHNHDYNLRSYVNQIHKDYLDLSVECNVADPIDPTDTQMRL